MFNVPPCHDGLPGDPQQPQGQLLERSGDETRWTAVLRALNLIDAATDSTPKSLRLCLVVISLSLLLVLVIVAGIAVHTWL